MGLDKRVGRGSFTDCFEAFFRKKLQYISWGPLLKRKMEMVENLGDLGQNKMELGKSSIQ